MELRHNVRMHQGRDVGGSETVAPSRELRRNVALEVSVCPQEGAQFEAVVTDISREGCQLRTEMPLKAGELVVLKHEVLGTLSAEVRWACAGRVGLQFARSL